MENQNKRNLRTIKVEIDKDLCIGAGPCTVFAQNTFGIDDNGKAYLIKDWDNSKDTDQDIIDAAKSCPVCAIKIIDIKTNKQIYP